MERGVVFLSTMHIQFEWLYIYIHNVYLVFIYTVCEHSYIYKNITAEIAQKVNE